MFIDNWKSLESVRAIKSKHTSTFDPEILFKCRSTVIPQDRREAGWVDILHRMGVG